MNNKKSFFKSDLVNIMNNKLVALFDDFVVELHQSAYQQQSSNGDEHPNNDTLPLLIHKSSNSAQSMEEHKVLAKKHPWNSVEFLGGKGFNLVKLLQGGFHVPRGFFVITRVLYFCCCIR